MEIKNIKARKSLNKIWEVIFFICTTIGMIFLVILLWNVISVGAKHINMAFLKSGSSRFAEKAGVYTALMGSVYIGLLTALIAFPLGIGSAIYLYEYAPKNKITNFINLNISNLAGVPSIVYGMIGLSLFANLFGLGRTLITGALTLSLLILPVIITSSVEALKTVPDSLRQNALALGVTKWQMITGVVLPFAIPNIITGCILAISRGFGEAAPLLVAGAVNLVRKAPTNLFSQYTVMPIQIYEWAGRPQVEFQEIASAGIIVLMAIILSFNAIATAIRLKFGRRYE